MAPPSAQDFRGVCQLVPFCPRPDGAARVAAAAACAQRGARRSFPAALARGAGAAPGACPRHGALPPALRAGPGPAARAERGAALPPPSRLPPSAVPPGLRRAGPGPAPPRAAAAEPPGPTVPHGLCGHDSAAAARSGAAARAGAALRRWAQTKPRSPPSPAPPPSYRREPEGTCLLPPSSSAASHWLTAAHSYFLIGRRRADCC